MKNFKTTLLFSIISISSFAQNTFQFKGSLNPNSVYEVKMNSEIDMKMLIDTPVTLDGFDKESKSKMVSAFELQTKSFNQLPNNDVPFEITYKNIKIDAELNNESLLYDSNSFKALYDVKLKGISNENGRSDLVYEGPAEYKETFNGMLKSFESFMKYPTETFSIGQSHTIPFTTEIPLENGGNYNLELVVKYTLMQLENDWAYFDVLTFSNPKEQEMNGMMVSIDQYSIAGQMKVNQKDNNIYESSLEGPMNMTMQKDDLKIKMSFTYKYKLSSIKK